MILPKFLIADNEDFPENTYVVHTEKPRFILDVDTEEYEILDNSITDETRMAELFTDALDFYESELDKYDEDEE